MPASDEYYPPSTWPELAAEFAEFDDFTVEDLDYLAQDLAPDAIDTALFGTKLWSSSELVAAALVLRSEHDLAGHVTRLSGLGKRVATARSLMAESVAMYALAALAALDMAEADRQGPPARAVDVLLNRLVASPPDLDEDRRRAAWALLAHGRVDGIEEVLYNDPASAQPDPDEEFGGAVFTIQRHLARCLHHGADLATALPAWHSYLETFPLNLLAEQATYPELLWAARSVHVAIGGGDPASLLDWLRSQIE